MIYILTKPERLVEKLKFELFGTLPATACDMPRFGPGGVEAVQGDSCRIIPGHRVMEIVFDGGYKSALAAVRQEANENAAMQMGAIVSPPSPPAEPSYSDTEPMKPGDKLAYQ